MADLETPGAGDGAQSNRYTRLVDLWQAQSPRTVGPTTQLRLPDGSAAPRAVRVCDDAHAPNTDVPQTPGTQTLSEAPSRPVHIHPKRTSVVLARQLNTAASAIRTRFSNGVKAP